MNAEQAAQQLVDELVQAWNSRDGAAFSRLFAESADYVTGAGLRLAGRGQILEALFGSATKNTDSGAVSVVTQSVKVLGPDATVVLCTWRMGPGGSPQERDPAGRSGLMTMVMQRAGHAWRIILLQNTDMTP